MLCEAKEGPDQRFHSILELIRPPPIPSMPSPRTDEPGVASRKPPAMASELAVVQFVGGGDGVDDWVVGVGAHGF